MKLTDQDIDHYYDLMYPLMKYTNRKRKVLRSLPSLEAMRANGDLAYKMSPMLDSIWEDDSILDTYLAGHPELPEEDRETILSWKRHFTGWFILAVAGREGALLIDSENLEVYQVRCLSISWSDYRFATPPPLLLQTTLLPYKGWIIYDSTLKMRQTPLPPKVAASARQACRLAKKQGTIITTL